MQQSTINARLIQVASGKRTHPHYGLVCENAELYTALSTGVGISAYMKRYSRRESAEVYKVRCEITEQITPSIIDSLSAILEKGYRSFYRRELNYGDGEDSEAKTMAMEEMLRGYAGGMGVDGFCQARLIELQSTVSAISVFVYVSECRHALIHLFSSHSVYAFCQSRISTGGAI